MAEMIDDLEPLDPTVQNILDQESLRWLSASYFAKFTFLIPIFENHTAMYKLQHRKYRMYCTH